MMQNTYGMRIPFTEHLGVNLVEMTKEHALVVIEKRPELLNSWGATHGGVIMTMLDLVMSWAVRGHYDIIGGVLTVDMSVGFMKAGYGEKILAEGRVLHGGKSTAFCEGEARDVDGSLLAKAIGTFKLLPSRESKGA